MAGACALAWLAATAVGGPAPHPEVLLGMLGPLASACVTWVAVERAHRHAPESVTRVLMVGFAAKMVFFGAYLALMLRVADVRPMPFIAAFTASLVGLYVMEAFFLARLTNSRQSDQEPEAEPR
jgi:hypothetical protein